MLSNIIIFIVIFDQILDHNHLHEALWLMHKTGMENRSESQFLGGFLVKFS